MGGNSKVEISPPRDSGGSIPTLPLQYHVQSINKDEVKPWILTKHYAHRMPSVLYAFGLYESKELVGVCTFGMSPNYIENKAWHPFDCLEFNRLIINTESKNAASYLVGNAIKLMKKPTVFISYADIRQGHVGYVYQATNWIYTGIGGEGQRIYIMKNGDERHQRHEDTIDKSLVERIEKTVGKARYYYLHGSKTQKKQMLKALRYPILPYPKGESKRYDSGEKLVTQPKFFNL